MIKRSAWAVLDQGLFSGAHFVLNILLARWLLPESYGVFAIFFALFTLIGICHTSLFTEPMLVLGGKKYRHQVKHYFSLLVIGGFFFTVLVCLLLLVLSLVVEFSFFVKHQSVLWVFLVATPFMLTMWLLRRSYFVYGEISFAAVISGVYVVVLFAALIMMELWFETSVMGAYIVLAVASVVTSVFFLYRYSPLSFCFPSWPRVKSIILRHFSYGKWALATGLALWVPANFYFFILPIWGGLDDSGILKAMVNFIMPPLQAVMIAAVALIPQLVNQNQQEQRRTVRTAIIYVTLLSAGYWIFLISFDQALIELVYGDHYSGHASTLILLGLIPVVHSVALILGVLLRARQQIKCLFIAGLGSLAITITLGLALVYFFGLWGAIWGYLIATGAELALLLLFYIKSNSGAHLYGIGKQYE